MEKKAILVTGGAGYIGSHVVKQLGEIGHRIVVLDNFSTGFADAVLYGTLIEGDTGDRELVSQILDEHKIESVLHFAAHTIVSESVSDPLKYYRNNTCSTRNLLQCCSQAGVKQFIFSSTAAVYGNPAEPHCSEVSVNQPINPYGTSKLMSEWMLRDLCEVSDMRCVILRYFNVAGSDPEGKIGQSTAKATLLIKVAAEVVVGKRDKLLLFGTDYPTTDGTCIRDYIHVSDLADAHIQALNYLDNGGESTTLNCGYGHGYSVREVIDTVNRVNGEAIEVEEQSRRAGDPAELVAAVDKIHQTFDWTPKYDDLDEIVRTSLAWERKLQARREAQ